MRTPRGSPPPAPGSRSACGARRARRLARAAVPSARIRRGAARPSLPARLPAVQFPRPGPARARSGRHALLPLQSDSPAAVRRLPRRPAGPFGAGCGERGGARLGDLARHRAYGARAPVPAAATTCAPPSVTEARRLLASAPGSTAPRCWRCCSLRPIASSSSPLGRREPRPLRRRADARDGRTRRRHRRVRRAAPAAPRRGQGRRGSTPDHGQTLATRCCCWPPAPRCRSSLPWLLPFLFGDAYAGAVGICLVLLLAYLPTALQGIIAHGCPRPAIGARAFWRKLWRWRRSPRSSGRWPACWA